MAFRNPTGSLRGRLGCVSSVKLHGTSPWHVRREAPAHVETTATHHGTSPWHSSKCLYTPAGDSRMILGVTPKVDYAFKYTFGKESTRPILIDVLGHVLHPGPGHGIQVVDLLNPFNPKESFDDKLS